MKILKQIKQIAGVVASRFACSEGRASSTPELPIKAVKQDLSKLTVEELEAGMMNSLVRMGAITAKEGQEFLFTGEMPSPELISKRIMEIYGK